MRLDRLHYEELEQTGRTEVGRQISCGELFAIADHFKILPSELFVSVGAGENLCIHVPKVKNGSERRIQKAI